MNKKEIIKRTIFISMIIIAIDQLLKIIAISITENSDKEIIKNFIYITQVKNIGVAFSLNSGNLKNILISGVIIFFIIRYLIVQSKYINVITLNCLDLVIAGGLSNLIDRVVRGGVIDFIKILDFPIFNLADCVVIIGWAFFAIYIIRVELKNK